MTLDQDDREMGKGRGRGELLNLRLAWGGEPQGEGRALSSPGVTRVTAWRPDRGVALGETWHKTR